MPTEQSCLSGGEDTRTKQQQQQRSVPGPDQAAVRPPEVADSVLGYCNWRCNVVAVWKMDKLPRRMYQRLTPAFYDGYLMSDCTLYFCSHFSRNRLAVKVAAVMFYGDD